MGSVGNLSEIPDSFVDGAISGRQNRIMMATLGRGTRRRYDSEKKRFRCIDCGVDTCETDDYYMVYDHVWHAAGMVGSR
jgi:hypothetical protein